jgi:Flp pilus assembly protein TadG
MTRRPRSRGSTVLEFALVGVPMMFVFISIVEMSRAMWTYQTVAYAAKETNRYIATHGTHCGGTNNCLLTVANVATAAQSYAVGLNPGVLNLTLTSPSQSYTCSPVTSCSSNSNQWPPTSDNPVGTAIQLRIQYQFNSAMAMLWPGAGRTVFGTYNFGAYSKQRVVF